MADEMEDVQSSELDLDYLQFKQTQLLIFKHDFRETASRAMDESHQNGFRLGFTKCLSLAKKIGRLKGTLVAAQTLASRNDSSIKVDEINRFTEHCERLLDQLGSIKNDMEMDANDTSEFTFDFAKKNLPDFDVDDMDLFLGESWVANNRKSLISSKTVTENVLFGNDKRFDEIQSESNTLFDQCCSILHSFGICDEFLYKN